MKHESIIRPTRMLVDLRAIEHNIREIARKLRPQTGMIAVIKASGYGSGAGNIVDMLLRNGVSMLAVAIAEEGMELREQGVDIPILVLVQPSREDLGEVVKYGLTPAVSDYELAVQLDNASCSANKITNLHVEVDTGMGRTGISPDKALGLVSALKRLKNVNVEGIFTHFACSDTDAAYTKLQIDKFEKVLEELSKKGIDISIKHACNSAAILNFPEAHYDMVRPGLMLYGYYPNQDLRKEIDLIPSLALKSKVVFLKEVPENTSISYSRTFKTRSASRIATIPIGYADGYRRALSNKGRVVINGVAAPIVGTICMDMCMADVTHIPDVKVGDEVILFDQYNITVEDIAKTCGTINYEIISTIGARVPRVYIR